MRKNLLSLGVVSAIMLGLSSELIRAQAWSDQSAVSKTGYRLTAENISSSSADIIGDMSQALPEYDITQITLPDGSTAEPDQVNYQVTQSGDYSFEITYQTVNSEEDKSVEMTKFQEHVADVLSEDASKGIEVMSESEEEVSTETQAISESGEEAATQDETQVISESGEEETTQIQTMSDIVKDMTENPQTETVTLTVNLPVMQTSDEADSLSTSTQFNNQLTEISPNNSSVLSAPTTSQISDRSAGISTYAAGDTTWDPNFDYYGSKLEWGRERFDSSTTYYVSSAGMDFNSSTTALPSSTETANIRTAGLNLALTNSNPLTFIYGYKQMRDTQRAWIQYSHGFSDINIDLSKDFAMTGSINVGSDFGKRNPSLSEGTKERQFGTKSSAAGVNIDGGVTISLIPTSDINSVMNAAKNGLSGGPRLGAYGAFKNSIVMEYDSGFTIGYDSITNQSGDSFTAFPNDGSKKASVELSRVGDVNIGGYLNLGGINLTKKEFAYYADGTDGYSETYKPGSTPHMGISLTGSDGFAEKNSDRRLLTGYNWQDETAETGVFTFTIEYHKDTKTIDFNLLKDGVSTNSSLKLPDSYAGNTYRLATSFGAIYQNANLYDSDSGFFKNRLTADSTTFDNIGTGQIAMRIQGVYTQPSLNNVTNKIMFTDTPSGTINNSVAAYKEGYVNGDSADTAANKRSYFPVEGDRVVVQNEADISSLFNEQGYTASSSSIKLTGLDFTGLSFVDSSGKAINKPSALDDSMKIEYYYSINGGGKWTKMTGPNVSNLNNATITGSSNPLRWRVVVTLPQTKDVTNTADKQFWLTGKVRVHVARDSTTASFNLPLIQQNSQRLTFFSDPKVDESQGIVSSSVPRVINKTGTLYGNQAGSNENSISYGIKVFYNSTQQIQAYNPNWTDQNTTYTYKSINDILAINKGANSNNTADSNISLTQDTRYIVNYTIYDSKFNEPGNIKNYSGNADRAKTSIKRVIWNSSKVTVENGYEFYMEPEVTLSVKDFENFATAPDKAVFYRKIAKAANVAVFKTSDANWSNLARDGSMEVSTAISGNGQQTSHDLINKLIASPGTSQEITIRFTSGNTTVDKTVNVTLTADTPKVVSNGSGNSITNQTATKIIFDKENYTVSATFKLANADNTPIDLSQFNWDDVKAKINVALYKKNGPQSVASNDKYYRWANKSEATNNGKAGNNTKLNLPVDLKYNSNGTFTVTYTLLNNNASTSDANWVQKTWEDGAEWKILAWTDANKSANNYADLENSSLNSISLDYSDSNVPSVTTTIKLIERESNGNLPETMFKISDVQLNDDGKELSDKRKTTTISLESIDDLTDDQLKAAQHDYYYEVRVNESNVDSQSRPYTTLTQNDTNKSFNVTYLKYTSDQNSYSDVKKDNTLLGSIAYLSNSKSLPQSIRFGMRADRQTGITSNQKFIGQANFKFVRKSLSGGANP